VLVGERDQAEPWRVQGLLRDEPIMPRSAFLAARFLEIADAPCRTVA
jgi:hypothetical protein